MARQQQLNLPEDSRFERLPEATEAEALELLVSASGMVETPRLQAKLRFV